MGELRQNTLHRKNQPNNVPDYTGNGGYLVPARKRSSSPNGFCLGTWTLPSPEGSSSLSARTRRAVWKTGLQVVGCHRGLWEVVNVINQKPSGSRGTARSYSPGLHPGLSRFSPLARHNPLAKGELHASPARIAGVLVIPHDQCSLKGSHTETAFSCRHYLVSTTMPGLGIFTTPASSLVSDSMDTGNTKRAELLFFLSL